MWIGAGPLGRSGRVALYFREDAPLLGPPAAAWRGPSPDRSAPDSPERALLRARLQAGPCFFTDLLAELDLSAEAMREALFDLVWAGEATNDSWAPLRELGLALAPSSSGARSGSAGSGVGLRRAPGARGRASPRASRGAGGSAGAAGDRRTRRVAVG